jgi:arsenate reductase
MAEALLPLIGGQDFLADSAGTHPAGLNPATVEALREIGVDWQGRRSKGVNEFVGQSFDYVITVCDRAKESCPIFPGSHKLLHWSFDDPAAAPLERRSEEFRRIRDEIAGRLRRFLIAELKLGPAVLADRLH